MGPPDNELGVSVGTRVALVKRDGLAIAVIDLVAYSNGVGGRLAVKWKDSAGMGTHPMDPRLRHGLAGSGELPPELLRFGAEFADGRRATTVGGPRPPDSSPDIVLMQRGGGGGSSGWELGFWLWPLPPEGPLTLAVEWPSQGVDLTTAEVDTAPIREASARSEKLWENGGPSDGNAAVAYGSMRILPRSPAPERRTTGSEPE
jgi:hypothetical protein